MEVAIVNLIGAGLVALSPDAPGADVRGLAARGFSLIAYLVANGHPRVGQLVEAAAADLAPLLTGGALDRRLVALHLEHLPAVMDFRPGREYLADIDVDEAPIIDPSRQIAMHIVASAIAADAFPEGKLSPEISVRLLSCLLQTLRQHRPWLAGLDAGLAAFLAAPIIIEPPTRPSQPTATHSENTAPAQSGDSSVVETERLPTPLAKAIAMAFTDNGVGEGLAGSFLAAKLAAYQEIAGCLGGIDAGDAVADLWADALQTLAGGRIEEAERLLGEAEAIDLRAAEARRGNFKQRLLRAIETRILRGRFEELHFGYREAVGHYAAAMRVIPARDRAARWRIVMLQADAMFRAGTEFGDAKGLEQACALYAEALELEPGDAVRLLETHAGLGEAQLALGLSREQIEPLEAATGAFAAALEIWVPDSDPFTYAGLQSQLGTALWALGNLEPSMERLAEAAAAKRAALEAFAAVGAAAEQAEVERQLVNLRIELGIAA